MVLLSLMVLTLFQLDFSVPLKPGADPGFPTGGTNPRWGRGQPLMQTLFGKNMCQNKRIAFGWVRSRRKILFVDPSLETINLD